MKKVDFETVIKKINDLPPLPEAVTKLYQLTNDLDNEFSEMSKVIATDQSLTAKILKLVNSAFYGLSQKVSTVSHAIVILGFKGVRNLALSLSIFKNGSRMGKNCNLSPQEFWKHSLATGVLARTLARRFFYRDVEEAFVAGLLHDIGKLVFMEHFKDLYNQALGFEYDKPIPLHYIERKIFGDDHSALGGILCNYWKLPPNLCMVVSDHHGLTFEEELSRDDQLLLGIVRMANNLSKIAHFGNGGNVVINEKQLQGPPGVRLTSQDVRDILLGANEEIKQAEVFFEMAGGE